MKDKNINNGMPDELHLVSGAETLTLTHPEQVGMGQFRFWNGDGHTVLDVKTIHDHCFEIQQEAIGAALEYAKRRVLALEERIER